LLNVPQIRIIRTDTAGLKRSQPLSWVSSFAAGGAAICFHSLQAIGAVHQPPGAVAVVALIVAILCRSVMSTVKFRVGRRIQSASLVADAWNDTVDILSAVAALTAVVLANYDPDRFLAADHYGGFVIGVIVIGTGIRVVRDASLALMDTMPGSELTDQIRSVVPGVLGVEGLRSQVRSAVSRRPAHPGRPFNDGCEVP